MKSNTGCRHLTLSRHAIDSPTPASRSMQTGNLKTTSPMSTHLTPEAIAHMEMEQNVDLTIQTEAEARAAEPRALTEEAIGRAAEHRAKAEEVTGRAAVLHADVAARHERLRRNTAFGRNHKIMLQARCRALQMQDGSHILLPTLHNSSKNPQGEVLHSDLSNITWVAAVLKRFGQGIS